MAPVKDSEPSSFAAEVWKVVRVGAPCVFGKVVGFWLPSLVTLACAGRAGQLAPTCLAITVGNATGWSVNVGLSQAIDTLCSQAYGAQAYAVLGHVLQRAFLVMAVFCTLATSLWLSARPILVALGQDEHLAAGAQDYLRVSLPALWAHAAAISTQRWLGAQGETRPLIFISLATLLTHVVLAPKLTGRLGLLGPATSWSVASMTRALLTVVTAISWPLPRRCWEGWSLQATFHAKELANFLRLALPSVLMLSAEWLAFETLSLMAGLLPNPETALAGVLPSMCGLGQGRSPLCAPLPLCPPLAGMSFCFSVWGPLQRQQPAVHDTLGIWRRQRRARRTVPWGRETPRRTSRHSCSPRHRRNCLHSLRRVPVVPPCQTPPRRHLLGPGRHWPRRCCEGRSECHLAPPRRRGAAVDCRRAGGRQCQGNRQRRPPRSWPAGARYEREKRCFSTLSCSARLGTPPPLCDQALGRRRFAIRASWCRRHGFWPSPRASASRGFLRALS